MADFDLKKCTLTIKDGTGTPLTTTVNFGEGNFQFSITNNIEYRKDRGKLGGTRQGEEEPVDINFAGRIAYCIGDTGDAVSIYEALTKTGNAASWVSSDTDVCQPYAVDLELKHVPACASLKNEVYLFADFRPEKIDFDGERGMITVSGKANITKPSITRVAPA